MPNKSDAGYSRPPKHAQFRKGQSGNPHGRPKGTYSFKADLAAELKEKISLTENGRERKITKQRALIKTLTAAAIKKDIRAVNALLACMRTFGVGSEETAVESADVADLDLLENFLVQERKRQNRANTEAASKVRKRSVTGKKRTQ